MGASSMSCEVTCLACTVGLRALDRIDAAVKLCAVDVNSRPSSAVPTQLDLTSPNVWTA